jgi:pimeloyl-ACP methyl ester carboxylesterase
MKYIALLLVIYLGFGGYLYLNQRNFIYFPVRADTPGEDEEIFENEGEKIRVSVLNRGMQNAIIYFGGNAENVDYNTDIFKTLFRQHTVYLVKYRGYSGSTGSPSERGLYSDAIHIYDQLSREHTEISIIGRSLGAAIATYIASRKPVHRLALITPFDSVKSVARSQFPLYPVSLLIKDKYDSLARAADIDTETMIIGAGNDRIIDISHARRLAEGFSQEVSFHVIEGADHNDISDFAEFYQALGDFIKHPKRTGERPRRQP